MAKFPNSPSYTGPFAPIRIEADIEDLEIEGEVPEDLDGAFYRVQPDPKFPPLLGDDIAFNGDGMITMFRFRNGRVDLKQRWVHTDKWKLEKAAGRALFGAYRNPKWDEPSVKGRYRGTANTNAFFYGGLLFGLKEDSPPVAMDPNTLETKGYWDFGGQMTSPTFTAHPKIDPHTGNMCAFGYAAKGLLTRDIVYYEFTPQGEKLKEVWFEIPYYAMMHDYGLTKDYACFHVVPCVSSSERLEAGLPHFGFDTTKEIHLLVLPRNGDARDIRTFTAPNCFASHVMNAFNDGTKIHFDTPQAKNNMFPFFPDIHGAPFDGPASASFLTRWTVDMASNSNEFEKRERLTEFVGEFPRMDERYATEPYRHGWLLAMGAGPGARAALGHVDAATGRARTWQAGADRALQEPCFIPKSATTPEGEGYVVQLQQHIDDGLSDLLLFDAQRVDEGPMATIRIPMRMRFGLHGNWVHGSHLEAAKKGSTSNVLPCVPIN
ncbi:MAG TPA: carotenoid oxygenase family protein [Rhizomicrobium sp.]